MLNYAVDRNVWAILSRPFQPTSIEASSTLGAPKLRYRTRVINSEAASGELYRKPTNGYTGRSFPIPFGSKILLYAFTRERIGKLLDPSIPPG